ncbi:MAG: glycogen synthase GlgA [Sphingobacteriia bacterium]|nr:glycogen synthase GlgA [Sphingobacteriia bacterium]NCC39362.1 glycogen synthase GlgA [Gammaproteobacteria bacterium]
MAKTPSGTQKTPASGRGEAKQETGAGAQPKTPESRATARAAPITNAAGDAAASAPKTSQPRERVAAAPGTARDAPTPRTSAMHGDEATAPGQDIAALAAAPRVTPAAESRASGTATHSDADQGPAGEPESSSADTTVTDSALAPAPETLSESDLEPAPESEPTLAPEPEPEPRPQSPAPRWRPELFIVQITPELAPVAKVGGLADVVFGLTRELAIRGNHVETILPKYDNLRYDHIFDLQPVFNDLWVPWYEGSIHCSVYFGFVHGRKCFFIEPHSQDNFFNRGSIYGFNDDLMRFAFFSRAAMEFLLKSGKHPDVIHCHDWQTALVPVLLYEIYQHLGMTHPRVCLTIHNFKHQGVTGAEVLRATGLHQPERYFDGARLRDNHNANALNLLKGGIVYSNFVTTVSPRYAFETKDQGQGFGLEPTLHSHHVKYGGVINGVDYDVWNPEVDRLIPVHYGMDTIDGKYDNKRALRHRLMLADNEKPIIAFIGRLDPQKGLELVRHAIFYTLERGGQFVLLGSSPDHAIQNDFWGLKRMLNDSPDCHLEIGFDEDLSHLIYAGADMVLVPSRFEPCGLTQLIAMRYGTIPVVRAIGGLADTVFDKDHSNRPLHERNGYVFENYDQPGLESALGRAIACYAHHPEHFRELMKNAMRSDYSWNRPGEDYLNIYDYIREK